MTEPWSKFFWSDYDADEGLRMCSLAAQGLWMRMLCLMARATPKGELRVGGEPCTVTDLSRAVGESDETVQRLLGELERRGVFSTTRAGVIFSRRLRKDAEISRKRAKAGAKGASVRYGQHNENEVCYGKNLAKPLANASPQKPEARKKKASPKKIPLPEDWEPEPFKTGKAKAISEGWSADRDELEVAKFKAHHRKIGNEWVSWQDAWQTWVLNSKSFEQRSGEPANFLDHIIEQKRVATA